MIKMKTVLRYKPGETMKCTLKKSLRTLFCMIALSSNLTQAARLKVYNMSDRALHGFTSPVAPCEHGREDCSFFPYQSIFDSESVTFDVPGKGIEDFYWSGIIGPFYKIRVGLQKNEHATIELHGGSSYKFKSKRLQYAETVR